MHVTKINLEDPRVREIFFLTLNNQVKVINYAKRSVLDQIFLLNL